MHTISTGEVVPGFVFTLLHQRTTYIFSYLVRNKWWCDSRCSGVIKHHSVHLSWSNLLKENSVEEDDWRNATGKVGEKLSAKEEVHKGSPSRWPRKRWIEDTFDCYLCRSQLLHLWPPSTKEKFWSIIYKTSSLMPQELYHQLHILCNYSASRSP